MRTTGSIAYQFGPFEVHPASGVLLKDGRRVKLQDQPFRLLVVLVENAQQVVARNEVQQRLWNGNTFVDFDSGLRVAVRKLREALGDDADEPRYIETVPKRGYRLIVPALEVREPEPASNGNGASALVEEPPVLPAPTTRRIGQLPALVLVAIGIVGALALAVRSWPHSGSLLSDHDTVVLADFANGTGDSIFDDTLRQALNVALEQSPYLSLVSDDRIQQTLRLMEHAADARLRPDVAMNLCRRLGADAVLDGSIGPVGTAYVLTLRATSCHSGGVLDEEQAQAARKEDVLHALDQIAGRFRTRVGESLATVQEHDTPLAEATTPSLDALKAYSLAWKVAYSNGAAASIPFFERAIELDSKFAMAYAALAVMYGSTGESAKAAESSRKAYELRDRASDRERFFITAYYDGRATGNQIKALQTCEAWSRAYPRDPQPPEFLSGFIYPGFGRYESAVEAARRGLELSPDATFAYENLAGDDLYLNRLADAEAVLKDASARKLDSPILAFTRFDLAFLKHDTEAMDREIVSTASGVNDWLAQHQAFVLARAGRLQEATRMLQRAADIALEGSHRERSALFRTPIALWQALFGDTAAARRSASGPLELTANREVEYGVALALALAGDSSQSERLARDLEDRFPEDTSVKFSYLPTVRAAVSLNHREPSNALGQLQAAAPYELGTPRSSLQGFFGALYPVYVRGEAYLAAGDGRDAAREFRKILDHPGIIASDPVGTLAMLQLARALALAGDLEHARHGYEQFLEVWREADAGLPILSQARAEYARLR